MTRVKRRLKVIEKQQETEDHLRWQPVIFERVWEQWVYWNLSEMFDQAAVGHGMPRLFGHSL